MKEKQLLWVLILMGVFQAFNGFSGVLGGVMLVKDPTGESLFMKLEWLTGTPFNDFLIPGIILLAFNGMGNLVGVIVTIAKKARRAEYAMVFGMIMMIWIITQVIMLGYLSVLQPLYFFTGLIQLILGALAWKKSRIGLAVSK